ncbi:MAG: CBS domain-containing protein, partial [Actinomycetota bacterium]
LDGPLVAGAMDDRGQLGDGVDRNQLVAGLDAERPTAPVGQPVSELTTIVHRSRDEGAIEGDDAELLSGALRFAQRPVGEVATPLDELRTLRLGASADQAERVAAETGRERIPISQSDPQRPLMGYVHARDLFAVAPEDRRSPLPLDLIRTMATVRSDRSLTEVLRTMRRVNRQVAVVEEGGVVVGIVSVEQVIQAILERSVADDEAPTAEPVVG